MTLATPYEWLRGTVEAALSLAEDGETMAEILEYLRAGLDGAERLRVDEAAEHA